MKFDLNQLKWTREPEHYTIADGKIELSPNRIRICGSVPCQWLAHDGQAPDAE